MPDLHRCGDCWWYVETHGPEFDGLRMVNEPHGECHEEHVIALPARIERKRCYRDSGQDCTAYRPRHYGSKAGDT